MSPEVATVSATGMAAGCADCIRAPTGAGEAAAGDGDTRIRVASAIRPTGCPEEYASAGRTSKPRGRTGRAKAIGY